MKSVLLAAALAVASSPAFAVDFSAAVNQNNGEPYLECSKPDPANAQHCLGTFIPLTLGHMVSNALNVGGAGLTNDGIVARGLLAMKIRDAHDVDLSATERDVIKASLFSAVSTMGYSPIAVVQALRVIDPASLKDK